MTQANIENLEIWRRSIDLADAIHQLTKTFPREELFGLTDQLRKASVSISSNIAEGSQRTTAKDFANFLLIAKGSLAEVQTQLFLSKRFGYINDEKWAVLYREIQELHRMIYAFHQKIIHRS